MPEALQIGPLLIPTRAFGVVILLATAVWASGFFAQRSGLEKEWVRGTAEGAIWVGLIGARGGFVLANWRAFADAPWSVLYFWQPGYSVYAGVALGTVYVLWRVGRRVASERLRYLMSLACGYGFAGTLAFSTALAVELKWGDGTLRKGDPAPDFTLQNLAGDKVSFSTLEGQAVILNFWATWCPPCRREMPALDAVHQKYAPRGVTIVGIDLDEPRDTVRAFAEKMGVSYPIWLDAPPSEKGFDTTSEVYKRFGGVGLPTTYFIDASGVIQWIQVGELSRAFLENWAEALAPRR